MPNVFDGLGSLISPAAVGDSVREAFKQGRIKGALARFANDPTNPARVNALMAVSPELGFRAAEYQRAQVRERREQEFGGALSDYVTSGGGNALLGQRRAPSPGAPDDPLTRGRFEGVTPNALMVPPAGALSGFAGGAGLVATPEQRAESERLEQRFAGLIPPDQPPPAPGSFETSDGQEGPDLSSLGTPRTGRDHAFLRMVRADPLRALKIQSELRDNFVDNLKDTQEVYRIGAERLASANDEPSYQRVLAELSPMVEAIGGNLLDHVPPNYPGPEGMQQVLMKALDAKERVTAFMQQANIDADNQRADRNTESLIEDRTERRSEVRRYHDVQAGVARRGQDIRDRTQRQGQSARDATTRRGQDIRGSGAGRRSKAMPTATGPNGEKVQWDGKAWVPLG